MSPEILSEKEQSRQKPQEIPQNVGAAALQLSQERIQENELKDKRIVRLTPIYTPNEVIGQFPATKETINTVESGREKILDIMANEPRDDRLLVIVGPCSIHDTESGLSYADWLVGQRIKYGDHLEIVMRAYLEKPRTTTGWKGLINDPRLDGSFAMNEGLLASRKLLRGIAERGVPVATELLDTDTPQYLDDLISYGAIGARTTESQLHRELVSGVSMPVGFKNGTGGSIQIAIDAMKSAASPHTFFGVDKEGKRAGVETSGNKDTNIILRGSSHGPNYDTDSIARVSKKLKEEGASPAIIVDVSHANSGKDYLRQPLVAKDVAKQVAKGNRDLRGVMIESNLEEGNQKLTDKDKLIYGQSITDACLGLADTAMVFDFLAESVLERRKVI